MRPITSTEAILGGSFGKSRIFNNIPNKRTSACVSFCWSSMDCISKLRSHESKHFRQNHAIKKWNFMYTTEGDRVPMPPMPRFIMMSCAFNRTLNFTITRRM